MRMQDHTRRTSRRGSIYLITLVTVAAIVSMVLIGVSLRRMTNDDSALIELMSANGTAPIDGTELALATIMASEDWFTDAQKGVAFTDFTMGERVYSSSVIDADTLATPTDDTTLYRVSVGSATGASMSRARFDLRYERYDYEGFLGDYELQLYWPMNEKNNPAAMVEQVRGDDGVYNNPSVAGKAKNEEGGPVPVFANASDHAQIPWSTYFDQQEASLSFWIRSTGTNYYMFYGVMGLLYDDNSSLAPTLSIGILNHALIAFVCEDGNFSYSNYALSSANTFTPNAWHHVVVSWGDDGVQIYVDGVRTAHNSGNRDGLGTTSLASGGHQPVLVGRGYLAANGGYAESGFEGSISHLAMTNRQLSSTQVAEIAPVKPDHIVAELIADSWIRLID